MAVTFRTFYNIRSSSRSHRHDFRPSRTFLLYYFLWSNLFGRLWSNLIVHWLCSLNTARTASTSHNYTLCLSIFVGYFGGVFLTSNRSLTGLCLDTLSRLLTGITLVFCPQQPIMFLLHYVSTKNDFGSTLAAKSFHLQKNRDGNCIASNTLLFFEWLTFRDTFGAIW